MTDAKRPGVAAAAPPVPQFDVVWDEETLDLAYEQCSTSSEAVTALADAIDNKVLAIFAVTSAIAGLVPALQQSSAGGGAAQAPASPGQIGCFLISGLAWVWVVVQCYRAYRPSDYAVPASPTKALDDRWLRLTPAQYRFFAIRDMGEAHQVNAELVRTRGRAVRLAMIGTVVEVLFLGIGLLAF